MTTDAKVQIGLSTDFLEGTSVTTPAGANLFREGVVISDPEIAEARCEVRQIGTELTASDWGVVTHSIIQGHSTAMGGAYHDVKVTPSGALTVEAVVTGTVSISKAPTGSNASVAASTSQVTLLAANTNRKGATVFNDSASSDLKLSLGSTASATSFTIVIAPQGYYEVPFSYTGIITGIWAAAVGSARMTELV